MELFLTLSLAACLLHCILFHAVFLHVHKSGGSVAKAAFDLLPFVVFFPSLLYYGANSSIALPQYPLLFVSRNTSTVMQH